MPKDEQGAVRKPPRVPVEERLFSLVLALLATESGLTKHDILSTVQGYRQKYRASGDNANLERQFERDKDDIRDLGVPLETIETPGDAGNNQTLRYRIPRGEYELPADVRFSAEETALLGLAGMVWREGSISSESRRALLKLRGLGAGVETPLLGYAPRLRLRDAAFEPLSQALERHLVTRFPYLKPGEERARDREVVPLALVQYQGRWHFFAEETGTGAEKMFLLRRIVGPVALGRAAPPRPGDHGARALESLERVWDAGIAEVRVVPETDSARRLAKRRGASSLGEDTLRLHFVDLNILADELASFGPEVRVMSPPALVEAVVARLERSAADHG
ncbi:helix-turn-helix transcriptional regulator [Homoserinibacter sp. YIM 151385]|uniref:helix-turn-helix transcriptional regulator n=1 Tax=Homoserinibacter sp. YIM 151385 TaxID=2985506 RepID=UPI0022F0D3AF|nr:WYL domain-containing protein [Homoserinibacter sp. YIM 151385]WBU38551.1 WYL domain-containing protein [Homoserinibacter sp. YIM 151385]